MDDPGKHEGVEADRIYFASGSIAGLVDPDTEDGQPVDQLRLFRRPQEAGEVESQAIAAAREMIAATTGPGEEPETLLVNTGRRVSLPHSETAPLYTFLTKDGAACLVFERGVGAFVDGPIAGATVLWTSTAERDGGGQITIFGLAEDSVSMLAFELPGEETVETAPSENAFAITVRTKMTRPLVASVRVTTSDGESEVIRPVSS